MHIVISGTFWSQPSVGSGQYLHGLLSALPRVAPQHHFTLLVPGYLEDGRHETRDTRHETRDTRQERGDRRSLVVVRTPFDGRSKNLAKLWFEQIGTPVAAARLGADLLHVPYAAPPLRSTVPVVATIHDIIWHLLPEYRGRAAFRAYTRLIAPAARRAALILADSAYSRRDIVAHLGCAPEQVTAVLLAAGPQYRPRDRAEARAEVAERFGLRGPFVYYVGGLDARKNIAMLLRAWSVLGRSGGPPATLAIAGRALGGDPLLFPDLEPLIDVLGLRESVRRLDVPHADNPLLYAAATAFAYPSRYEGFGLPPLEAMACGTPAVVADASSLPEVVADAALRVNPDDLRGWAEALWRLLADGRLRDDLRERGLARAATFSYDRVARETVAAYERAANKVVSSELSVVSSTGPTET